MLIDLIVGARPNFMKVAPIMDALTEARRSGAGLEWRLVHTGQHYDANMSAAFLEQLGLPTPDVNLEVGSGTQAEQTAAIMIRYERLLRSRKPDLCVVVGDVNSTMACAITAKKVGVSVAHVEAGIRSGDLSMPEEINRIVTDSITDWFFTTSRSAENNLRNLGVPDDRIFFVGNTMIDTLRKQMPFLKPPRFWKDYGLCAGGYLVLTLHRPPNVDNTDRLRSYLAAIEANVQGVPVIFPMHPRTAAKVRGFVEVFSNFRFVEPLPYQEFNYLVKHAKALITDSGGITEETTVMGVPCMTLRDNTERPETVTEGTNEVLGTDPAALEPALGRLFRNEWKRGTVPELWDGKAAVRIVSKLVGLSERIKEPTNTSTLTAAPA